jgi:Predicted permeases
MELILKALVPLAFIITLGWLAGWRKIIDPKYGSSFATYILNFSLPCLLFIKTATTDVHELINYRFLGALALGLFGMYILIFITHRYLYRRPINHSCQAAFTCSFPNMAFIGIPIFMVLFGEQALVAIIIGNIVTGLLMIPVTVSVLELAKVSPARAGISQMVHKVITKPLVLAPIFGIIISVFHLSLPSLVVESLKLFGSSTSGISLFTLGLIMSGNKVYFSRYMISNIVCKNFLHPLIMFGIVCALGITGNLAKEAILLCALPSAITATIFAVKYNVIQEEACSSAVVGTAISLLSVAIVMHLLGFGG